MKRVLAASFLSTCLIFVIDAQTQAIPATPPASANPGTAPVVQPGTSAVSLLPQVIPVPVGIPEALLDETLAVMVLASVPRLLPETPWESRDLKYTIPGTAVSVKMIGSDVAVLITVTPYRTPDGRLLLVTQGQVWHKDGEAGIQYRTTLDTINLAYGERVFFYPFGINADGTNQLRIELMVIPYRTLLASPTAPAAPASGKTGP